VTIITSEKN